LTEAEKQAIREHEIHQQYGKNAKLVDKYKPNRKQRLAQASAERKQRGKTRGR
jgi:hypothetical protein